MNQEDNVEDTAAIIQRILSGDNRAFERVINDHQRLVNHIVYRMVSNPGDREDVCQDIFMKVYQNLVGFRLDSKLSTWIARIAYNRCIDYLNKNRVPVIDEEFDEAIAEITDESATPEKKLMEANLSSLLQEEINHLSVQFRTIVTLYHLDELSYAEIGDVMSIPEGTVKNYLFRARKLLRERLTAKYTEEEFRP
ncbi:MAG: RNA polymerase subunit sigma-24 [candidate division Zixibacteria bacterium HGW-Zixibacteria-1]|nr:MAG: RNA polymerase subunit sigma-24 [candidate division Zixibacteria bacterium HGW-Zixibacteria-1]